MPPSCKRFLVAIAAAALPACWATAAVASPTQRAELQDLVCQRAADPVGRGVTITAAMRPVSGTSRMALKFDLERRPGRAGPFNVLRGHDLGRWVYPTNPPTLGQLAGDVWMLKHNVVNLRGPDYYRFRVSFRWLGSDGRVLGQAVRLSPLCYQPEPRADLQVRSITVNQLTAQQDSYTALVHNGGATAAGRFSLELRTGSSAPQSLSVQSLPGQSTVEETFTGPACTPGSSVTVTADPDRRVDDFNRSNNVLTVACPAPSGA